MYISRFPNSFTNTSYAFPRKFSFPVTLFLENPVHPQQAYWTGPARFIPANYSYSNAFQTPHMLSPTVPAANLSCDAAIQTDPAEGMLISLAVYPMQ